MPKLSKVDRLILNSKSKKKWIRYCPKCGSTNVTLAEIFGQAGYWYRCLKCYYRGHSFPEKVERGANKKTKRKAF